MTLNCFFMTPATAFGLPVCRLGLASYGNTELTADDILEAVSRGVNFLNWAGFAEGPTEREAVGDAIGALGELRASVVICVQFGARTAMEAVDQLKAILKTLRTDYIDVVTLYYVETLEEWTEIAGPKGSLACLKRAQRDGMVRYIGVTSHQRKLAARMAGSGNLDALMIRYNAAHRGAEADVFPVTARLSMPVIAYTALRWGALIRATPEDPAGFHLPPAPLWYRFVLQRPEVAVTLAAPQSRAELDADLRVLEAAGPLESEEYAALAAHGERVRKHAGKFR